MKRKTVALYDPYLETFGGGEKHIFQILAVIQKHKFEVDVFWHRDVQEKLNVHLNVQLNVHFDELDFLQFGPLKRARYLSKYDIFIHVSDGSYFFSNAKNNYIFAMVPQKNLFQHSWIDKLKLHNYSFVSNSKYTQKHLQNWGIHSDYLYPPIDSIFLQKSAVKENIILSVGRFFPHLHSKRHDIAIQWFQEFQKQGKLQNFTLYIAGTVKREDEDYFHELKQKTINNNRIVLKPNLSFDQLLDLYARAKYYWHFGGYGIDETKEPEKAEHLGITPLEAMASGAVPFVYNVGGPKETIQDGENGFTFLTKHEMLDKMLEIETDRDKYNLLQKNGKNYILENFSYEIFEERVKEVFDL